MNSQLRLRTKQYAATLRLYLQREQEAVLHQAYELGRKAIGEGFGVLDMARIHQQALVSCLSPALPAATRARTLSASETFILEALSPFEATHRGFRLANLKLRQLNAALGLRNRELARINHQLEGEIKERRRAERALQESEASLRSLSKRVLHAQEEERKRISRELHDEVGQALTAVSTNLVMLQRNGAANTPASKLRIADAQNLLAQAMNTVHTFARELRPAMLDELGLVPALRSYLKCFADRTGLRVRFSPSAQAEKLDEEQKIAVFRITQESLTNVAKHARATQVVVTLSHFQRGLRMRVRDNGRAFDVTRQHGLNGNQRLGLLGMQERVRLFRGRFGIRSAPGKGTTVSVEIPFRRGRTPAALNS
jgi:signal transduction histidine kinase